MLSMAFKFKHANRIVGIFVFSALALLVGGLILVAMQQKVFVKKYTFRALFLDAEGLSSSTSINFKGYEIGRITDFRLNDQNLIDAEFYVVEEYRGKLVENSALNKAKNPLTGTSKIELLQGPDLTRVLPEGSLIPSINVPDGRRLVELGLVEKTGDPIASMVANLDQFLDNLNRDNNVRGGAVFRAMVNLANAAEKLDQTLLEVTTTVEKLNREYRPGDGQLFTAINRLTLLAEELDRTADQVNQTLSKADVLIENYQSPDELAVKMIDPTREKLITPVSELMIKLNRTMEEMNDLLNFVNTRQPELADLILQGRTTIQTAKKTLEGVNNNPLIRGGITPQPQQDPEGLPNRPGTERP